MKFFDREQELKALRTIREDSRRNAQFTIITGRRRIGKTTLVREAYADEQFLYFFVEKTVESDLCAVFQTEIENKLHVPMIGRATSFSEIFEYLMKLSQTLPFTLFIDEFQDFERINPAIFSEVQRIWDEYQNSSKINLLACGSIYSMMTRIFTGSKEPLFNRQTNYIRVKPFRPDVLKTILAFYYPEYTPEDLLALYCLTGGVAKYVQLLVDSGAWTAEAMFERIISPTSVFIGEGKSALVEEFGRNYNVYFSILSAIASGKTRRAEIEAVIGKEIGGYLTNLEREYGMIDRLQPLYAKSSLTNVVYQLNDNFYTFWFRFIYKYNYMLEIGNYEGLRTVVRRDYSVFSGIMLEKYFRACLADSGKFTRIGNWWDRKGENEIDIIAENEFEKTVTFYEVKRQASKLNLGLLRDKAAAMMRATKQYGDYTVMYKGLSMEDM